MSTMCRTPAVGGEPADLVRWCGSAAPDTSGRRRPARPAGSPAGPGSPRPPRPRRQRGLGRVVGQRPHVGGAERQQLVHHQPARRFRSRRSPGSSWPSPVLVGYTGTRVYGIQWSSQRPSGSCRCCGGARSPAEARPAGRPGSAWTPWWPRRSTMADADGPGGRLDGPPRGQALGVGTMTLYTYVPSRAELVDLMVDEVLTRRALPAPGEPRPAGWRDQVRLYADRTHADVRGPSVAGPGLAGPPADRPRACSPNASTCSPPSRVSACRPDRVNTAAVTIPAFVTAAARPAARERVGAPGHRPVERRLVAAARPALGGLVRRRAAPGDDRRCGTPAASTGAPTSRWTTRTPTACGLILDGIERG